MAPLEPWQRVWIDAIRYTNDVHSLINCTECHGGQAVDDMELAHNDMIARPAADAVGTCGTCHRDIAAPSMGSLHSTLRGYDTVLYQRSIPEHHDAIEQMQEYHCNSCHTTCGDCHISQPQSVGGGLLSGHTFVRTPPMSQTCTGCHGSRVKDEYFGLHEEYPSDVHFRARMSCVSCHNSAEMHGIDHEADHRYDGPQTPSCESCHQDQVGVGSGIEQHEIHGTEILSCQVCHSVGYTNCVNCHVARTEDDIPFFRVEDHFLDFRIGVNPLRSAERPYRYVTLRHVPADPDAFSFYGENLLPNFNTRPTWVYSTPHNIQRRTPQTASCDACHGNAAIFLTEDRVLPHLLEANRNVIVSVVPPLREGMGAATPAATPSAAPAGDDGFWGDAPAPTPRPSGGDDGFWGSDDAPATPTPSGGGDGDFWGGDVSPRPTPTPSDDDGSFWGP